MPRGSADTERTPDRSGGSNGVGIVIAGIVVAFFAMFPFILIAVLYLFLTIYAIVRAFGPGANPVPVVVGFVLITSALAIVIGVTIHLVGRSITPKRSQNAD